MFSCTLTPEFVYIYVINYSSRAQSFMLLPGIPSGGVRIKLESHSCRLGYLSVYHYPEPTRSGANPAVLRTFGNELCDEVEMREYLYCVFTVISDYRQAINRPVKNFFSVRIRIRGVTARARNLHFEPELSVILRIE